ncbi:50S ribosomal protein L32e [Candidatus Pacearchaeota archaeon CG10_big_fil_rev_8_21_14_0_10_32_42]|nr:MAG: 50S ribosomal protein L32e [Candidatus Pacearchaeota archaeon CG10_big_fil_rev_8_21_14_0_10_32_42]
MTQIFLRRDVTRFSKFGKGRGKKAKWRRPTGRDNKMREKRKGYPAVVGIGSRTMKKIRGLFEEKKPIKVMNLQDLEKIGKNEIGVVGNVGNKKKIEISKKAKELKIKLKNLNSEKFLKKNARKETKTEKKMENKK